MHPFTTFPLAVKSIAARPGRSLGAVAGLALGIAMYVALSALSQGYLDLVRQPLAQLHSDASIQKPGPPRPGRAAPGISLPPGNSAITPPELRRIVGLEAVDSLEPALLLWERSPAGFTMVLGFDPRGPRRGAATVQGWLAKGAPLRREGDILLEKHFARVHRKKVGDTWRLGGKSFTIRGTVEIKAGGILATCNAFVTLDQARALAGLAPGTVNLIFLRLKPGRDTEAAARELAAVLPGGVLTSADRIGKMMRGFGLISGKFATLLGALALIFTGAIFLRLVKGVLGERQAEVGIMKTLGWTGRDVSSALVAESLLLGAAGAVLGVAVGWLAAWAVGEMGVGASLPWNLSLLPAGAAAQGPAAAGQTVSLPVVFSWLAGAVSLAYALVLSAFMAWRVSRRIFKASVLHSLAEP